MGAAPGMPHNGRRGRCRATPVCAPIKPAPAAPRSRSVVSGPGAAVWLQPGERRRQQREERGQRASLHSYRLTSVWSVMEREDFTEVSLEAPLVLLVESLRNQIRTVQSLQDEEENMQECWGRLQVAASNLKKHCPSSVMGALASVCEDPQNDDKEFVQKCEQWMNFTADIHKTFKKSIPGHLEELQKDQREYEELQNEISTNEQRFNSVMENVLPSWESGDPEKRGQLLSKFTLMKEQWHHVSWVVQQRKKSIDGFLRLWHLFLCCLLSLNRCLVDTKSFVASVKTQDCHSHHQRRNLIKELKLTKRSADDRGSSTTSGRSDRRGLAQPTSLFRRAVAWALVLFVLLLLLLFFLTSVIVPSDEFDRCMSVNNFARSFNLMLQYPHGPPPL
ncbi:nesprin-1-like [Pogoniulus pusillus]|uniref:nesprin-1-like n=1 Tax=Pogoniulus pusillus TaxID=488313 RepID=UPI0030B9262F